MSRRKKRSAEQQNTYLNAELKITQMPDPLPDEVCSSFVCRLFLLNRIDFSMDTLVAGFAGIRSSMGHCLEELVALLPKAWMITTEMLVDDLTLANFTATLLPRLVATRSEANGVNEGLSPIAIVRAARTQSPNPFFCPTCIREQRELFGTAYWTRAHQIRDIMVCVKHNRWLQDLCPKCGHVPWADGPVPIPGQCSRCRFDFANIPEDSEVPAPEYLRLAQTQLFFLEHPMEIEFKRFQAVIHRALLEKGLFDGNGELDTEAFHALEEEHIGRPYFDRLQIPPYYYRRAIQGRDLKLHCLRPVFNAMMIDLAFESPRAFCVAYQGFVEHQLASETKKATRLWPIDLPPDSSFESASKTTRRSEFVLAIVNGVSRAAVGKKLGIAISSVAGRVNTFPELAHYRDLRAEPRLRMRSVKARIESQPGVLMRPNDDVSWAMKRNRAWFIGIYGANPAIKQGQQTELYERVKRVIAEILTTFPPVRLTVARVNRGMGKGGQFLQRNTGPWDELLQRSRETHDQFAIRCVQTAIDSLYRSGGRVDAERIVAEAISYHGASFPGKKRTFRDILQKLLDETGDVDAHKTA